MVDALPNPQELDENLTIEGVERYKRHDCRRYVKCLDVAADAGWQQFHCNACNAYEAIPKNDDPLQTALARLGRRMIKNGDNR